MRSCALLFLAIAALAAESRTLTLTAPIDRWDEAIPLGNGLLGGLLWGSGNELRLSLDRGDLWDLRPHPAFVRPGFNYAKVIELATAGRTEQLNKEYSRASDFPTKLPGARLVLTLDARFQARQFQLDMQRAEATVDYGKERARSFFSATEPVALLYVPGSAQPRLVPNEAVKILSYLPPKPGTDAQSTWLTQDAALGFRYVILAAHRPVQGGTLVAMAITTNKEASDPLALARQRTTAALNAGYEKLLEPYTAYWQSFWARSSITIPDERIQQHYNLVRYFHGAASRPNAPPMPLQGVWTADEGTLPPWHGDYHHDLNTQLTYWAYPAMGHFEEGRTFLDFMWSLKPTHEALARSFYGLKQGLIVPGVMSLDGAPMGTWFQYSLSPTMGAWVAQSFYWHWRYEANRDFLATRAYPYCAAAGEALAALLKPDGTLPLSTSPEIHNNSQRAWLKPNSNFDQALLHWLFAANAEMAEALGRTTEATQWAARKSKLAPLALDLKTSALLLAPGEPLTASHRHHSHLMAIHPLGLLHPATDGKTIDASFHQIEELGTSQWTGYSFSWMAALRARAGRGNEALRYLSDYVNSFILRNGFHVNGEQTRKGLSNYHYRPFTLEGNFAAAQAVHEMLLQSWGGKLRVFPAVPYQWRDAAFEDLRAEGGFAVTAERRHRRTTRVLIRATVEQTLHLISPFEGRTFESNRPVTESRGEITCKLNPGETLELKETPAPKPESTLSRRLQWSGVAIEDPNYTIWGAAPIQSDDGQVHLYAARWPEPNVDPAWRQSSEIAHYVAPRPEGPFRFADVALRGSGRDTWDKYAPHNPEIRRFEGRYVLLYIANPDYRQPPHPLNQSIGMALSDSPYGPWRKAGKDGQILTASPDPAHFTHGRQIVNPTLLHIRGRYHLYFKTTGPQRGATVYGVAIADKLEGPYQLPTKPLTSDGVTIEDATAFEWNGKVCLLTTDNHGLVTGVRGGGALWVSDDGVTFNPSWTQLGYDRAPIYYPNFNPNRITKIYGPDPKFERPKILTIDGKPAYLYAAGGWNMTGGPRTVSHVLKFHLQPGDGPLPQLPRVLIIGDSISIGYTPEVKRLLQGKAIVEHNPGNAGHTGRGLENLDQWLGNTKWDVIHFNWGLWDLAYRPNGSKVTGLDKINGTQTWPLPEYEKHLRELVTRLKKTGARLLWATTTPVPDNEPGRHKGDEVRYNQAAQRIMYENGILTTDLYSHMLPKAAAYALKPGDVHYAKEGYAHLARKVAAGIEAQLHPVTREYFQLRGGLRNSLAKFSSGGTARVAFLGGSITAMKGWRDLVCQHLRQRFPQTTIECIDAGIPSTGSTPGAFRLQRDVFSKGPVDLLFEEAAVNDDTNQFPPQQQLRGMEGIVRQARLTNPNIDIVLLHFVDPGKIESYRQGRTPSVIATHEKVAEHYRIPSIDLAREVTERIDAGEFTWDGDFVNLHPSPFGHEVYLRSVVRLFDAAWKLPEPLDPQSYFHGRLEDIRKATPGPGWSVIDNWQPAPEDRAGTRPGFVRVPMLVSETPGAEFRYRFEGSAIGLFVAAGPDAGIAEFSIDGAPFRRLDLFTRWSPNLHIPWAYILDADLKPGPHELLLRVSAQSNPASRGHAIRIAHLLVN